MAINTSGLNFQSYISNMTSSNESAQEKDCQTYDEITLN